MIRPSVVRVLSNGYCFNTEFAVVGRRYQDKTHVVPFYEDTSTSKESSYVSSWLLMPLSVRGEGHTTTIATEYPSVSSFFQLQAHDIISRFIENNQRTSSFLFLRGLQ